MPTHASLSSISTYARLLPFISVSMRRHFAKEGAILDEGFGQRSFQRYRSGAAFLSSAIPGLCSIAACAAAVDHKIATAKAASILICSATAGAACCSHSCTDPRVDQIRGREDPRGIKRRGDSASDAGRGGHRERTLDLLGQSDERDRAAKSQDIGGPRCSQGGGHTRGSSGGSRQHGTIHRGHADERLRQWHADHRTPLVPTLGGERSRLPRQGRAYREVFLRLTRRGKADQPNVVPVYQIANLSNRTVDQMSPENWMSVNGSIRDTYISNLHWSDARSTISFPRSSTPRIPSICSSMTWHF